MVASLARVPWIYWTLGFTALFFLLFQRGFHISILRWALRIIVISDQSLVCSNFLIKIQGKGEGIFFCWFKYLKKIILSVNYYKIKVCMRHCIKVCHRVLEFLKEFRISGFKNCCNIAKQVNHRLKNID